MTAFVARPIPQRQLTGQRHAAIATAHVRLMILMLLLAAGFALVIGKILYLGITASPDGRNGAAVNPLVRSDILDRNGEPLARTISAWSIGVRPANVIGNKRQLAQRLAEILPDHDAAWYYGKLIQPVKFTYLARHTAPTQVNAINDLGEPGLAFEQGPDRLYPQSTLAAHVLGYIGPDEKSKVIAGRAGIERAFDARLVDGAQRGNPIVLSLDYRAQAALESELGHATIAFKAQGAAGVILNVQTGEVIAMASFPVYNPNRLSFVDDKDLSLRNNVTQSVYELGSTFKPIAIAAAIDSGTVTSMARRFDATVPIKSGNFPIHDDKGHEQRRWLNIPETLIYSSNIATAKIAELLGKEREQAMFRAMGFGGPPAIELREKETPLWPRRWGDTSTLTAAYGHGISVTPLHLASAYATMVNGGFWRPTTLLRVEPGHVPAGRRVLSAATSARMRQLLRMVVLMGTGRSADVPGYRVGGKTGTAEKSMGRGYSRSVNVSTFAAAFPMDNPRYVIVATLDAPIGNAESGGATTAAATAAPVVGRVIARVGSMLGVMPDLKKDVDISELKPLIWRAPGKDLADVR